MTLVDVMPALMGNMAGSVVRIVERTVNRATNHQVVQIVLMDSMVLAACFPVERDAVVRNAARKKDCAAVRRTSQG